MIKFQLHILHDQVSTPHSAWSPTFNSKFYMISNIQLHILHDLNIQLQVLHDLNIQLQVLHDLNIQL